MFTGLKTSSHSLHDRKSIPGTEEYVFTDIDAPTLFSFDRLFPFIRLIFTETAL